MKELDNLNKLNEGLCVLEVYSANCAGCKKQVQIIEKLEGDFTNINFFKTNAEELGSSLVQEHELSSAPSIIIFKEGEVQQILGGLTIPNKLRPILEGLS